MKKNVYGKQLKRDTNERKALFKNLMTALVLHDRIQTTEPKAKAVKASVEKLVTKAKKRGLGATPDLLPFLHKNAVKKIIEDIAPRFSSRPGGYTRIIKLGRRFGDDASAVVMEWVERSVVKSQNNEKTVKKVKNKAAEDKSRKAIGKSKTEAKTKKQPEAKKSKIKTGGKNK